MKGVIMAGGEGSRLRPLTCDLPKPMVPVMNIPTLEYNIRLLKSHGITEIAVTLKYFSQKIIDHFGDGADLGVNLHYFIEDMPLGTAGSVKNAEQFLDEPFIVMSGDSLTDIDLSSAIKFHQTKKSKATLVLYKVPVPLEYGVVLTDSNGAITNFLEKPGWGEIISDTVNTGTYILDPYVFNYIPKDSKVDFSQNVFPKLLEDGIPMFGHVASGYWCDIGDLSAYRQSQFDALEGKININIGYKQLKPGIWVGEGATIEKGAKLVAPCIIGENCRIKTGAEIGEFSIIGNNTVVESATSVKRCIIWNDCYVESNCELRGAILCSSVKIRSNVSLYEGSVIGEGSVINERSVVKPDVKIWPHKSIESLTVVDRNVIWGSGNSRTMFGQSGFSGIINVDVSPEFAARLGAAYGSIFPKGGKVIVSSTTSNPARMFKHAFISGILSVGVEVFNMSSMLTPTARYATTFLAADGGIHIKLENDNPNKICVDFMNSKGASIGRNIQRKIESAFYREDFRRCSGDEVSRLNNITDFANYYSRSLLSEINSNAIKSRAPKVCVVSPSDFVISMVTPMLADAGCKVASLSPVDISELEVITQEIKSSKADFAAFIDGNAETLVLIDKSGRVIRDDTFLLLTSLITFKSEPNSKFFAPVTTPSAIEELAAQHGGKVVRTKSSPQAIMEQMLNQSSNHKHASQFLLNFDAIGGLIKIVEYICANGTSLNDILKEIPTFHMSRKKIFCPWDLKGRVMRTLIDEKGQDKVELLDGVKFILEKGWALVLPDADMPVCRVYSEADSMEAAEILSDKYLDKILSILDQDKTI